MYQATWSFYLSYDLKKTQFKKVAMMMMIMIFVFTLSA